MTTPAATNAPVMPMTSPRTSRVCPANAKPVFSEPRKLSPLTTAPASRRPLIDGRFQMTMAATRNVTALRYSARLVSLAHGGRRTESPTLDSSANTIAAATGVRPYVVTSESWLAGSIWSRRSMLGTAASLAGIQNRLIASMRNWAMNSQTRLSTSGIETKNPKRRKSATTIVLRRSNRSANAPASGPSTMAGRSRKISTAPRAKFLPAKLSTSEVAVAVIASRPSQSPKLDSAIDSQSRRKSRTRRTARIFATRPTAPISSPGCSSASGARASAGTGVPPGGRPSGGTAVRSSGCAAGPSTGGCAGRGGADPIGGPRGGGGGGGRPPGNAHGTGRGRRFPALSVNRRRPSVGSIRGLGSRDVPAVLRRARPPVRRVARPGAGRGAVGRGGPGLRGGRVDRLAGRALARGTDHRRRLLPRDARRRGRLRGSGPRVLRRRRRPRLGAVRAGRRPGEQRRPALGAGARAAAGPLGGGTGTGRRAGGAG